MKKKLSLGVLFVSVLAVLCLVLAGCGGGSEATDTSAADSADAADASAEGSTDAADAADDSAYTLVSEGTLTCISETGFAPFEYIDVTSGSTDPVGYDIDVANEVASRLGLECEFLPSQDFDTLLSTISEGNKADIAIAGITIDPTRAEIVDFSDAYYTSNLAVVLKDGSVETLESLDAEGKQIACQSGTTGNTWIEENLTQATCVPLPEVVAGLSGVSTGLYDAYVIDLPVAEKNLRDSFTDLTILERIATGEEYGIAISKDNPGLTAAINDALADMEADGTLQEIWNKWMVDTEVEE